MQKGGYVYIMSNYRRTVLYTGVTSSLLKRVPEHINKIHPESFTAKYNVNTLVYFEWHDSIEEAIRKEKLIKGKSRAYKLNLIKKLNPNWNDLYLDRKVLMLI